MGFRIVVLLHVLLLLLLLLLLLSALDRRVEIHAPRDCLETADIKKKTRAPLGKYFSVIMITA
jgi:hypothetical protein